MKSILGGWSFGWNQMVAVCWGLLILVTWPLWWLSTDFPCLPWFAWGLAIPRSVDRVLIIFVLALLGSLFFASENNGNERWIWGSLAVLWGALLLLSQQRCQPWAWQLFLYAVLWTSQKREHAVWGARWITLAIYVHSARTKCDWAFCTGLGPVFCRQLLGEWGANNGVFEWLSLFFPFGELLVAVGLAFPASRRWGLWGAYMMHALLLWLLGPWGLNHQSGVLCWNLFFLVQNTWLFAASDAQSTPASKPPRAVTFGLIMLWVWPLLEYVGYCDLWFAWGLYASHGAKVEAQVTELAVARLDPRGISHQQVEEIFFGNTQRYHLEWESLERQRAPVYPSKRFLIGTYVARLSQAGLKPGDYAFQVTEAGGYFSRTRRVYMLASDQDFAREFEKSWFNLRSRQ